MTKQKQIYRNGKQSSGYQQGEEREQDKIGQPTSVFLLGA